MSYRPTSPSTRRSPARALVLAVLIAAAVAPALHADDYDVIIQPAPVPCLAQVQPIPSGVTDRPLDDWGTQPDHFYLHSSTNLQGYPTTEKFAAGLFYFPSTPTELGDFQSVIVVTNPAPAPGPPATIAIDYFDEGGNLLATTTATIPAEGTHTEVASPLAFGSVPGPGRGSARIRSTNGVPIVGVTDHWAKQVDLTGFTGGGILRDPDPFKPGLSSMQQLQAAQATKTQLFLGPLPHSTTATLDFLNRNAPFFWVMNPNPTPTTVTINISSRNGVVLPTTTFTIPAFATHLDLTLWNTFLASYLLGGVTVDDDYRVRVKGSQAILGDVVMADFFGDSSPEKRFRIGSAMMANTASSSLVNADLTFENTSPGIQTIVGLFNPTVADVGPVRVEYFDRDGGAVGPGESFPTFPRGALRRIGPGLASSPNYPTTAVFAGWMRITACRAGLVGWTMRTAGDVPGVTNPGFNKVWGEELTGENGLEPGDGFAVTVGGLPRIRKVAPLVRADGSHYWPGYTTFVNDGVSNVGNYEFLYFATDISSQPNATPIGPGGAFNGVRFGATSFTYEDPLVHPSFGAINLSERVDTANGGHDGINVIGDPLGEWGIFDAIPDVLEP